MKISNRHFAFLVPVLLLFFCCLTACLETKSPKDPLAGPNLGFEFTADGLPANWIFFQPNQFDCSISLDSTAPREGKQSLRFDIRSSPQNGRMNFTGFTKEFPELTKGGGHYRLSFWIKNSGTQYRIYAGGVKAKESGSKSVVIEDSASFSEWKKMVIETDIPKDMWLRFEIRLKGKGTFQLDQVEIEKIDSVTGCLFPETTQANQEAA
jgi:hypothetical protein